MEFAHANQLRVNCSGAFGSKLSCIKPVPAWVFISVCRMDAILSSLSEAAPGHSGNCHGFAFAAVGKSIAGRAVGSLKMVVTFRVASMGRGSPE